MKALMLVVISVVLGCNYYGPDNPPPSPTIPPDPVYRVTMASAQFNDAVGSVTCPSGTVITGGGCDCAWCEPDGTPVLFGCNVFGNSMVAGCFGPCVRAHAVCIASNKAGTLTQGLAEPDPQADLMVRQWRARAVERGY